MTDESTHAPKVVEESFQKTLGLTMAAVATVFSIISWAAGKYSSMQSGAEQKVAYMHDWYNAKGIKQSLAEGQRDLLIALMKSGTIAPDKVETLQVDIDTTNANIARYKKEKKEMTLGSKAVGRENWAQDIDGVLPGARTVSNILSVFPAQPVRRISEPHERQPEDETDTVLDPDRPGRGRHGSGLPRVDFRQSRGRPAAPGISRLLQDPVKAWGYLVFNGVISNE
jgi:uncharacterized protein YcfL